MRDFEDFRDAVLNKISALEVSDDEKWEKLCKVLRKLCKIRNFSQSPFGGFIFEESDGNFPSGRN